jgi:hypothetical protein
MESRCTLFRAIRLGWGCAPTVQTARNIVQRSLTCVLDPALPGLLAPVNHFENRAAIFKVSYLQFFFFFQRRSPRTPASFMPR